MHVETSNPRELGMDADALDRAWVTIQQGALAHQFGGAVALILRHGEIALYRSTGWAVREPEDEKSPMDLDTIFDLASLTKVTATMPSILKLVADGKVDLDQPVGEILTEFGTGGAKADVTIRRLLSHTSGFLAWRGVFLEGTGADAYIANFAQDQPENMPGEQVLYSCPNFITLGEVVQRVTGESLPDYAKREVFAPLDMTDTMFTPPVALRGRIAATEQGNEFEADKGETSPVDGGWRDYLLRGEVHDGNAWYGFRGIAGNAGLFGTAMDLARYGKMWMNGGELDGVHILPDEIVREAIREQTGLQAPNDRRGLGWQMAPRPGEDSGNHSGRGLSQRAYGHTGFTGTSMWMDPERDLQIVLLTNRVHPTVNTAYLPTRAAFTQAIAEATT